MPKVSRNGDMCATGHLCTKKAPVRASQFSVFANGKPVLRRGDKVKPHTILVPPFCKVHAAKVKGASSKVFARGIGIARRGDSADFGAMVGASQDVVAG